MKRNKWKLIFLYILCVFIFQELVFRICFPIPEVLNFNRIHYQTLAMISGNKQFLRNSNLSWQSSLDTPAVFVHKLNQYGFRDKNWSVEKEPGKKRIFFLGDSFVEGAMAEQENTIPSTFSELSKKNIEVFNCGMMGVGWESYLKFLTDAVPLFQPDEVILVVYSNDVPLRKVQYNPIPEKFEFRKTFQPHLITVIKELQEGSPVSFRGVHRTNSFLTPIPSMSNPWTLNEKKLSSHVTPHVAEAMKKGTLNYFRTNWILKEEQSLKQPVSLLKELKKLQQFLKQHQSKLTVFYLPSRSQVSNYYYQFEKKYCQLNCPPELDLTGKAYQLHKTTLASDCEQLNINFFDLTSFVKEKEQNGIHLYWNYDDHMKGYAYRLLGKKIFTDWKSSAL